jgi:hypothetical protein
MAPHLPSSGRETISRALSLDAPGADGAGDRVSRKGTKPHKRSAEPDSTQNADTATISVSPMELPQVNGGRWRCAGRSRGRVVETNSCDSPSTYTAQEQSRS